MIFYAAMDNWVYLLFGALWIAFAIYKGNRKAIPRTPDTENEVSASTSSDFNKIVDSFMAEEVDVEDIPKKEKERVTEEPLARQEEPVVLKEGVRTTHPDKEPEKTAPRPNSRKINLKKAIIYSEILRLFCIQVHIL